MSTGQPVRSQRLLPGVAPNHDAASMRDQAEKASSANGAGKSDSRKVPQQPTCQVGETKPGNAGGGKAAKLPRERDQTPAGRSDGSPVHQRLARITERAERLAGERFNNLYSMLTYDLLEQAFRRLQRDKAPGIDGVTVDQYEANLRDHLQDLETRLHRQSYRPQPSLRREIPKGDGKTRPLGIAAVEDKVVQRAIVMILERIYEADFSDVSYGFRPGRSCHGALAVLGQHIATRKVNWILDADIKGFFDHVDHEQLLELLRQRIEDPRMLRLIRRFLKAGVLVEGHREATEEGVPQGSVLSPLLANVYLHYVLDLWFTREVRPRLHGEAYLIRYADDFICAFELETDARRFLTVLPKRLARFSLELAEDKTKLIRFGRFAERDSTRHGEGAPARLISWVSRITAGTAGRASSN